MIYAMIKGIKFVFILSLWLAVAYEAAGQCEDKVPHLCSVELQPHYCYLEHNRVLCCQTCKRYETPEPDCVYGDHFTRITRKDPGGHEGVYNCESYVGFYGRHHCANEAKFRQYCCKTCKA